MTIGRGKGGLAKSCNALLKRVEDNDPSLEELVILPSKTFGSTEAVRLAQGKFIWFKIFFNELKVSRLIYNLFFLFNLCT